MADTDAYTEYYALDLYQATDNANLLDKYNHTIRMIDQYLYEREQDITSLENSLKAAYTNIQTLQNEIQALDARVHALENPSSPKAGA